MLIIVDSLGNLGPLDSLLVLSRRREEKDYSLLVYRQTNELNQLSLIDHKF